MATTTTATALTPAMERVRSRLALVRQRPTYRAAQEFFQDDDWQSLAPRVARLYSRVQEVTPVSRMAFMRR
jgi:hypothetical protein